MTNVPGERYSDLLRGVLDVAQSELGRRVDDPEFVKRLAEGDYALRFPLMMRSVGLVYLTCVLSAHPVLEDEEAKTEPVSLEDHVR